jgi:hypothetical protein
MSFLCHKFKLNTSEAIQYKSKQNQTNTPTIKTVLKMVSQLSARLLSGYSDVSSDTSSTSSSKSANSRTASVQVRSASIPAGETQKRTQIKEPSRPSIVGNSTNVPKKGRFTYSTESIARSVGGSSGYSADMEQYLKQRTSPYNLDSIMVEQKEKTSLSGIDLVYQKGKNVPSEDNDKRRKRDEMNYVASIVREELAKGGITFSSVFDRSTKRQRVFPPGTTIDMSGVTLLSAKDIDSPFLTDHIQLRDDETGPAKQIVVKKNPSPCYSSFFEEPIVLAGKDVTTSKDMKTLQAYECLSTLKILIKSCSHMYELGINDEANNGSADYNRRAVDVEGNDTNGNRSDSESSTSTVTVANSDDMMPKPSQRRYLSIGEALSISSNARYVLLVTASFTFMKQRANSNLFSSLLPFSLIVLATSPYLVIQVNAAFLRFTGTTSSNMLGQQLRDLLVDETLLSSLKESKTWFSSISIPPTKSIFKRSHAKMSMDDSSNHVISITPVGSQRNSITHFAIEIENSDKSVSQESDNVARNSQRRQIAMPMTAMG